MIKRFSSFLHWFYFKKSNFSQGKEEQILNDIFSNQKKGLDLQVLKSVDLNFYDVDLILIEVGDNEHEIVEYLTNFNYFLYAREDRNIFFKKNKL